LDESPIIGNLSNDSGAQYLKPVPKIAYVDATMPDIANPCAESNLLTLPSDLHILLVENNLIHQNATALGLRKAGCTVHLAIHVVDCLVFLNTCCYRQRAVPRTNISGELLVNEKPSATKIPLSVILLD